MAYINWEQNGVQTLKINGVSAIIRSVSYDAKRSCYHGTRSCNITILIFMAVTFRMLSHILCLSKLIVGMDDLYVMSCRLLWLTINISRLQRPLDVIGIEFRLMRSAYLCLQHSGILNLTVARRPHHCGTTHECWSMELLLIALFCIQHKLVESCWRDECKCWDMEKLFL